MDYGTAEQIIRTNPYPFLSLSSPQIPVVMVAMQGSIGATQFLTSGLRAGTPAVIVSGSGGVCDVIVNMSKHHKQIGKVSRD